jgi:hypothetical protein
MNSKQILFVFVLASTMAVIGCRCRNSQEETDRQQSDVIRKSEALYLVYFTGTVEQARQALLQNSALLENSRVLEPIGRTLSLSSTYFRLYVLEKRCGNEAAAEADLLKGQYWMLKQGEIKGKDITQWMKSVKQCSGQRIISDIDDFDKRVHNGIEPAYVHMLKN